MTWTCTTCVPERQFATWGRAQRHANEAHHGARISVDVATRRPA